jgi:FkbM family methyltransferase
MNMMSKLVETGPQSHGQFAEDRILGEIFADRAEGYCVEIGAYDGRTGSASYLFEKRGWDCLLVEPIPALAEEIRKHRSGKVINCAVSNRAGEATFFVAENVEQMSTLDLTPDHLEWIRQVGGEIKQITVPTATLDSLLAEAAFPEIQFITIDVEGHEAAVLEGFTLESYRPRIVILEDNSVNGNSRVARYMTDRGYVHFRRTGINEWYAHESDVDLIRPDQVRRFERWKRRERWERRRKHVTHRVATRVGAHLQPSVKRRLRSLFDGFRSLLVRK